MNSAVSIFAVVAFELDIFRTPVGDPVQADNSHASTLFQFVDIPLKNTSANSIDKLAKWHFSSTDE